MSEEVVLIFVFLFSRIQLYPLPSLLALNVEIWPNISNMLLFYGSSPHLTIY